MHEVSIADSILDLIAQQASSTFELDEVELCIGPLSGVSPESLEFCFPIVSKQRGFGVPRLLVHRTKVRVMCLDCQREYSTVDMMSFCPHCCSRQRSIISGDELELVSAKIKEGCDV